MADYLTVDLGEARDLLRQALVQVEHIETMPTLPPPERSRDRSAAIAALSKELLFLAHLCKKAEVAVMDEYQLSRGFTAHYSP